MNLVTTTQTLRIVLGEAKTTNDCGITAAWADNTIPFTLGATQSLSNGVTPVTVVAAPALHVGRQVKEIRLHNDDTVAHTVTLQFDNNGTISILDGPASVAAGATYVYTPSSASSSGAVILLESGTTAEKISAMSAAAALDGTEVRAGVQGGANVKISGNQEGLLTLSAAFTVYPLDATTTTGAGTPALIKGGAGGSVSGNGGKATLQGGNATSGNGGPVVLQGGTTGGGGSAGNVLVNTATDNGTDALQINGSAEASSFKLGTGGPTWTTGAGAPASSPPAGSLYSRNNGVAGTTLYATTGSGVWTPVSGSWQKLSAVTVAAAGSSGAILLPAGYSRYRLTVQNLLVGTNTAIPQTQFSINGGVSYINTAGAYAQFGLFLVSTTPTSYANTAANVQLMGGLQNLTNVSNDGVYEIWPGTATVTAMIRGTATYWASAGQWQSGIFSGTLAAGAAINALQVLPSGGTFSGTFILEGLVT